MKVLLVKTSSMGDIIHTLPALTDATRALPGIAFDWVVEENFAAIPAWHPAVERIIPIAWRRWRRQPMQTLRNGEWRRYRTALRKHRYDAIIDAQGLLKSALLSTRLARGPSFGFDRESARESMAARFYQQRIRVERQYHAVERTRQLFAAALDYPLPQQMGDYGLGQRFAGPVRPRRLIFLHGTTWPEKHWPDEYWIELAGRALGAGWEVELPWSNEAEQRRAARIANGRPGVEVLQRLDLEAMARRIATAAGIVSVDTGLSHLAAALDRPNLVLFGPTDPGLVGGYGRHQLLLQASEHPPVARQVEPAIFAPLTPDIVWAHLAAMLGPNAGPEEQEEGFGNRP